MSQPSSYSQQQNILLKKKKRGESRKLLTWREALYINGMTTTYNIQEKRGKTFAGII
jgi:hypothetical protein